MPGLFLWGGSAWFGNMRGVLGVGMEGWKGARLEARGVLGWLVRFMTVWVGGFCFALRLPGHLATSAFHPRSL